MFPGYTLPVIHGMDYAHWVMLALAYDDYVDEMKKRSRTGSNRRRT